MQKIIIDLSFPLSRVPQFAATYHFDQFGKILSSSYSRAIPAWAKREAANAALEEFDALAAKKKNAGLVAAMSVNLAYGE
jgi:hypothetical protein